MSIILEFFSFNSYILDFGLEGGVLGLGLGLGLGSCGLGLGLGLEVCVLGLALALGVMSLLTSLIYAYTEIPYTVSLHERLTSFCNANIMQLCTTLIHTNKAFHTTFDRFLPVVVNVFTVYTVPTFSC